MLPVKPNHHRRRFHEGQRLSLKAFVGGSTLAHVVVSDAQRIQLGQVDYGLVRELGYVRLDQFQEAWVAEHDPAFARSAARTATWANRRKPTASSTDALPAPAAARSRSTRSSGSSVGTRTGRSG
jgi:hypothetical protein